MRYLLVLFALLLVSIDSYAQVVKTTIDVKQLSGVAVGEDEYIVYNNVKGTAFSLYLKSDVCSNLGIDVTPTDLNLKDTANVLYKGRLLNLGLDATHAIMYPLGVYYKKENPNLVVLELDMFNFISTRGYNYIVLEFKDNGSLNFTEFSENKLIKDFNQVFKKYKQGGLEITTVR
jgi:hypothetical protein